MKPVLYSAAETAFTSNGLGALYDAHTCVVEEERNGPYELTMTYPVGGQHYGDLAVSRVICAQPAPGKPRQAFRIYKITRPLNGIVTVFAEHISYQLSFIPVSPFTASSASAALAGLKNNAAENCPFTFSTDVTTAATYTQDNIASLRQRLGGVAGSVLDVYGGEYEWDNWSVHLWRSRGADRGVVLQYGKNLTELKQEEDIQSTITGVAPFWAQEDPETGNPVVVTLPEVVVESATADNYPYPRTAVVDFTSKFQEQPTVAQLREKAEAYIVNIGLALINNSLSFEAPLEDVYLCDTVTVRYTALGVETQAKVIRTTYDVLKERYESVEVGDAISSMSDTIADIDGQVDETAAAVARVTGNYTALRAEYADFKTATVQDLNAKQATIDDLEVTQTAHIQELEAHGAAIEELEVTDRALVNRLSAAEADIVDINTTKLTAVNASISSLDASYANVRTLLSGNAGTGELQTVVLTAANASISEALIKSVIAQYITVNDLRAGNISTDRFSIGSTDGGILLSGNVQQFYDADGNLRVQIGQDAQENFTFVLYDETGAGVLIDADGIKASAISDGLIVNSMVSENAAIAGSKLDIASVVSRINESNSNIQATHVYLDESGQTLSQTYTQMQTDISAASAAADAATSAAIAATEAVSSISTLDALSAILSNDAHVVHTEADGSGGDYTNCKTTYTLFLGDTDISEQADWYTAEPSPGVSGSWNPVNRTYQVTGMTTSNGYVDISAQYNLERLEPSVLEFGQGAVKFFQGALRINRQALFGIGFSQGTLAFNDSIVRVRTGGLWLRKRFSISKAPDGKIGETYQIRLSSNIFKLDSEGVLTPSAVTISAILNDNGDISDYAGLYRIEESTDGATYTQVYASQEPEATHAYTPTSVNVQLARITLRDETYTLDVQSVAVITDAAGAYTAIEALQEVTQTTSSHVAEIETGINGMSVSISDLQSETTGIQNTLALSFVYNTTYVNNSNGTATIYAHLYRATEEITTDYDPELYSWWMRSQDGEEFLGYGYSITVQKQNFDYGGIVVGRFCTYEWAGISLSQGALAFAQGVLLARKEE